MYSVTVSVKPRYFRVPVRLTCSVNLASSLVVPACRNIGLCAAFQSSSAPLATADRCNYWLLPSRLPGPHCTQVASLAGCFFPLTRGAMILLADPIAAQKSTRSQHRVGDRSALLPGNIVSNRDAPLFRGRFLLASFDRWLESRRPAALLLAPRCYTIPLVISPVCV
jgi:hypothetical protein